MYMKIHENGKNVVVAVCDEELLNKNLSSDGVKIDINKSFYGEKSFEYEEVSNALSNATIANLFGEKSVECGINEGLVESENVVEIDGVPHAQIFFI